MQTLLMSPLSFEECVARLESAKKKDDVPFSKDYLPPYGKLAGNTFTLQVNIGRNFPYMYGIFSKSAEGTLITCSMELSNSTRKFNLMWSIIALPFFLFMVFFGIFDAITSGFATTHFVVILMGIGLPFFKWQMQRVGKRQFELDKKELLDFLETTLDAKQKVF